MRRREVVVEMEKVWSGAWQVGPFPPPQTAQLGTHGRIRISDGPAIGQLDPGHIVSSPPAWISSMSWAGPQPPIDQVMPSQENT